MALNGDRWTIIFVGGRAIHEFSGIDRIFSEMIGIGIAVLCLIVGLVGKNKIEDIEWQEQNEKAEKEQQLAESKTNEPRA